MASSMLDKRESRIRDMFAAIAPWYDTLNHLLSFNIDRMWRIETVRLVPPRGDAPILDLCTGTGDLALAYQRASRFRVPVVGADFCHPMLLRAKRKTRPRPNSPGITYIEADAQQLPFADNTFQLVSVAFGLRNVTDYRRGLAEMVRVVQPGGRVAILEFSRPQHWFFGPAYRFYFRRLLPVIGQFFSKSPDSAYRYLPESVMQFPDGQDLVNEMTAAGLREVWFRPFTLGIATLYVGHKPTQTSTTA
jgi:demethylmenaquinone methyltransferase/2-methoxy-6-polyprenyl-1,4-benzoquinol methylase